MPAVLSIPVVTRVHQPYLKLIRLEVPRTTVTKSVEAKDKDAAKAMGIKKGPPMLLTVRVPYHHKFDHQSHNASRLDVEVMIPHVHKDGTVTPLHYRAVISREKLHAMPRIDHDALGAVDEEEVLRSLAAIAALLFITTGGETLTDTTNHSVKEEKRLIPFALSRNLLEVVDKATGGAAKFSTRGDKDNYTTTLRGHKAEETSQRTITDSGAVSHPQLPLGREVIRQAALTGTVKLVRVDVTWVKGEYGGVPPTEFVLTEIVVGGAAQRTTTSAPLIRVGINPVNDDSMATTQPATAL